MRPLYVRGLALWMPGFASLDAFLEGAPDEAARDPACAWVPQRLLRGSSRLTRMFGEVAEQAVRAAGADPHGVQSVYTSSYGEIETMVLLLDTIFRGDGQLSPMRFKNSVHNAGSGLASIGQGNAAFSTALAAGARSFEAGVLEALALANEAGGDVVVSSADDVIPAPLDALDGREGLAVGLVFSAEPGEAPLARVAAIEALEEPIELPRAVFGRALAPRLAQNPSAAALPLFEAILTRREGLVPLAFGAEAPYGLALTRP